MFLWRYKAIDQTSKEVIILITKKYAFVIYVVLIVEQSHPRSTKYNDLF